MAKRSTTPRNQKKKIKIVLYFNYEESLVQVLTSTSPLKSENASLKKKNSCILCSYKKRSMTINSHYSCKVSICGEHKEFCPICTTKMLLLSMKLFCFYFLIFFYTTKEAMLFFLLTVSKFFLNFFIRLNAL